MRRLLFHDEAGTIGDIRTIMHLMEQREQYPDHTYDVDHYLEEALYAFAGRLSLTCRETLNAFLTQYRSLKATEKQRQAQEGEKSKRLRKQKVTLEPLSDPSSSDSGIEGISQA